MMGSSKVFLAITIICLLNSQAYAGWFSGSSKPLTAEVSVNKPAVCRAIDENVSAGVLKLIQQVESGEIQQGSTESKVALGQVYAKGYEQEGYSLDATLAYCFAQTDMNFWANFYRYYGESLNFFLIGLEDPILQKALLESGVITEKTVKAYGNYQQLK